jgi:hypothetical protein
MSSFTATRYRHINHRWLAAYCAVNVRLHITELRSPLDDWYTQSMFVENYLPQLERDIEQVTTSLGQPMPDAVRTALQGELGKLQRMREVLLGVDDKSLLHQLRGQLRWRRLRLSEERDPAKKKELDREVKALETEIERQVKRGESATR